MEHGGGRQLGGPRRQSSEDLGIGQGGDDQRTVAKELGETFSDTAKVCITFEMLPKQAHGFAFQTLGSDLKYDETVEHMNTFVANTLAMMCGSGPAPMDVGGCIRGVEPGGGMR